MSACPNSARLGYDGTENKVRIYHCVLLEQALMEEYSQKQAIEILNHLKSGASWLLSIVLTLSLLSYYGGNEVKFFGVSVPKGHAGIFLLFLLCLIELNILRIQALMRTYFLDQSGYKGQEKIIKSITHHPWGLNPWAEFAGPQKTIFCMFGVSSLFAIWGMGALASLNLLKLQDINHTLGFILFLIYTFLGIAIAFNTRAMMFIFNPDRSVRLPKAVAVWVTLIVLMILFFQ